MVFNPLNLLATASPSTEQVIDAAISPREQFDRVWGFEVFSVDATPVTVGKLVIAMLILVIGVIAARIIAGHLGRRVFPRLKIDRGPSAALQTICYYVMLFAVVLIALQMASVPLAIFTIVGGALALGIGFGSQNIVANFISGLILLIERPIAVGDLVEVDSFRGEVEKIGARATLLKAYTGSRYIIPNSVLLETPVENWNHKDDLVRTVVSVGVNYGSDTARVREVMLGVIAEDERIKTTPAPEVLFTNFGDSALDFEAHFWITPANTLVRKQIESDLRYRIDAAFAKAEIGIPFPQRDLHINPEGGPVEVRVVSGG